MSGRVLSGRDWIRTYDAKIGQSYSCIINCVDCIDLKKNDNIIEEMIMVVLLAEDKRLIKL